MKLKFVLIAVTIIGNLFTCYGSSSSTVQLGLYKIFTNNFGNKKEGEELGIIL